ncbi:MAG: helix-turn-helix domain-containing protein [Acidobacteria bacterium]|nr:helix-turn-helix domain-containing protein [Acidobacteriota bacterium]
MQNKPEPRNLYGKAEWIGTVYLWRRGVTLERGLYVCDYAHDTDFHALPCPKLFVPLEGDFAVESYEWLAHLNSGEQLRFPAKNSKRSDIVNWKKTPRRVEMSPGQLTVVKNNYSHRLLGEGRIAVFYLSPDIIEGQELLAREDYDAGLSVIAPLRSEISDVLKQLSTLNEKSVDAAKEMATEIYNQITAQLKPASNLSSIVLELLKNVGKGVRSRYRLKRFQCEHNTRFSPKKLAKYIGIGLRALAKIFRDNFKIRAAQYVSFLRNTAAMQYCAAKREQHPEWREGRFKIKLTDLAYEVYYSDPAQFSRDFRSFFGIAPVAFYHENTDFILIDLPVN